MKKAVSPKSRWSRSCARPTRRRSPRSPGSTRSASRRSTTGVVTSAALEPADIKRLRSARRRERQAQAHPRRARSRDRHPQGDQPPKVVSSQARREQVAFACERGLSKRRACELLEVARSALAYRSVRAERDAPLPGGDETLGCTVPTLRLSADSDLPSSRGPSHESASCPSPLASRGPAAAPSTATSSRRALAASSAAGLRRQPRLGLRLRVRHLRQWPAA